MSFDDRLTRRGSLARLGTLLAAAAGGGAAAAAAARANGGPAAVSSGLVTCVLTPELTEGPYYIAGEKVRRNITEGHPGARLDLRLSVVDASTCKPIRGAAVDYNTRSEETKPGSATDSDDILRSSCSKSPTPDIRI